MTTGFLSVMLTCCWFYDWKFLLTLTLIDQTVDCSDRLSSICNALCMLMMYVCSWFSEIGSRWSDRISSVEWAYCLLWASGLVHVFCILRSLALGMIWGAIIITLCCSIVKAWLPQRCMPISGSWWPKIDDHRLFKIAVAWSSIIAPSELIAAGAWSW